MTTTNLNINSTALSALETVAAEHREEVVARANDIAASHGMIAVNGPIMRNAIADIAVEVSARRPGKLIMR